MNPKLKPTLLSVNHPALGVAFDVDPGAGGGAGAAATADPPNAGGAGAGGGGGGEASFSFFRNVPQRDLSKKDQAAEGSANGAGGAGKAGEGAGVGATQEKPFVLTDDAGQPIPGLAFATQEEAQAYLDAHPDDGKGGAAGGAGKEGAGAAKPELDQWGRDKALVNASLAVPVLGRFKTIAETEEYVRQSGSHIKKVETDLTQTRAEAEKARATHEAELAALRAELEEARKTPPFRELSKEDEAKLAKDDPVAFQDYRDAKRDSQAKAQKLKDDARREAEARARKAQEVNDAIQASVVEMSKDPAKYPQFVELQDRMDAIHKELGGRQSFLMGNPRAVWILYRLALAELGEESLRGGEKARKDAAEEARRKAQAGAAATAGTGAGAGKPPVVKSAAQQDQERWVANIRQAAPKRVLNLSD